MDAVAKKATPRVDEFVAQELANMSWAFAKLRYNDDRLNVAVADALLTTHGRDLKPQELANVLWTQASLRLDNAPLLEFLTGAAQSSANAFRVQELAAVTWACATLLCNSPPLIAALSASSLAKLDKFDLRYLANSAWAFARLAVTDSVVLEAIASAAAALPGVSVARPQEIANTAWACARLLLRHEPLLEKLVTSAAGSITEFKAQEFANLTWARVVSSCAPRKVSRNIRYARETV